MATTTTTRNDRTPEAAIAETFLTDGRLVSDAAMPQSTPVGGSSSPGEPATERSLGTHLRPRGADPTGDGKRSIPCDPVVRPTAETVHRNDCEGKTASSRHRTRWRQR